LIHNWLDVHKDLKLLVNTFFTALGSIKVSVEDKFLAYCFSTEVYHRIRYKSKEAISVKYKTIYDKIFLEVKSGDVSTFLKTFFQKERDIHFTTRLKELFTELGGFGYYNINEDFVKRIVKTRNYYVHLDDSLETEVFTFEEIIKANIVISKLMLAAFNQELIKSSSQPNLPTL
jgi:hypothetical protein